MTQWERKSTSAANVQVRLKSIGVKALFDIRPKSETLLISTPLHLLFLRTRRHFSFEPLAGQRVGWGGIMRDDLIVIEGIINE